MADYPDGIIPTSTTIAIDQTGLAKDNTVQNILNQLDITLTQLRDALVGSGNKSFTDIDTDLSSILGQLDITLSSLRDALIGTGAKSLTDVDTDLLNILNQLDITLSSFRDSLLDGSSVYSQLIDADETSDQQIELDKKGKRVLSVYAKATTATTFTLEFSNDNTNWFIYYQSASSEDEYKENILTSHRYWRLKSLAAGAAGDTVSLIISAT